MFMNCLDMYFQSSFVSKWLVANQTSEWFSVLMNCFDMPFQTSILSKWLVANQTSEWFSIFMNCLDMPFQSSFFSKWLVANQTNEWFGIFMNCIDVYHKAYLVKVLLQILHLKSLIIFCDILIYGRWRFVGLGKTDPIGRL